MKQEEMKVHIADVDELIQDDHNFNIGTQAGAELIGRSFKEFGAGRSVFIDKNNRLVGGNKAQKGFKGAGYRKVVIVDSDPDTLVAVRRKDVDLDTKEGREMAMLDNLTTQVNLAWDKAELESISDQVEGFDVGDFGFDVADIPMVEPKESVSDHTQNEDNEGESPNIDEMDEETKEFYLKMIGDYIYPSNNEFDIPTLLDTNQPVHLEMPFAPWGAESRYKKGIATYHFYVDDYRFEQLYKNPILLLQSGCKAVVEPNNSIHDQTPMAYAIYQTFRKRYLTRYLQECGIQVWVDLNVSPHFEEINALGVPEGYNAFCTRGVTGWIPTTERHWEMAKRISGLEKPNMFVYGGGKDVEEWCRERDIVYIKEYMNKARKTEE